MNKRVAWTLFAVVLLFLVTMKTHRTYMGQGDEPHYIVFTESLVFDRDLDVSNNYTSPYLRTFEFIDRHIPHPIPPKEIQYSWHSIGLPLLGIPSMLLARAQLLGRSTTKDNRWITVKNTFSFSMMIVAAAFAVFLFGFFRSLGMNDAIAWWGALLVSLTPPLLSYGFLFFTELPAAFMIIYLYSRWRAAASWRWIDGLLIGFLPWLHMRYALASVVLALLFLTMVRFPLKKRALLGMGVALMWGAIALIDFRMWSGLSPEKTMVRMASITTALPAMFFDRSFGLFVLAPVYAFSFAGLYLFGRENRASLWGIVLIALALLLPVSGFPIWWAGWSPGPRYLTPFVPFLALGVIFLAHKISALEGGGKFLKIMLVIFLLLSGLYWQDPRNLWNPEYDGVNLFLRRWFGSVGMIVEWLWPSFFDPATRPLFRAGAMVAGLAALNSALVFRVRRQLGDEHREPDR